MNKEYVDVDNVLNELFNLYDSINPNTITGNDARNKIFKSYKTIESLSNKNVQEVRHGRWVCTDIIGVIKCSECKRIFSSELGDYDYCPNCGCKMDGGKNND